MASEQAPGWEGLKAYAKSKAVGSDAPVVGVTGLPTPTKRVPVREQVRTMDRMPKMYETEKKEKYKKRAGYDTSSSDDEEKAEALRRPPPAGNAISSFAKPSGPGTNVAFAPTKKQVLSPLRRGKSNSQFEVPEIHEARRDGRGRQPQQHEYQPEPAWQDEISVIEPQPSLTVYEQSLQAIASEVGASGAIQIGTLEDALEATGAAAKLRPMTNEEAKQDRLERAM